MRLAQRRSADAAAVFVLNTRKILQREEIDILTLTRSPIELLSFIKIAPLVGLRITLQKFQFFVFVRKISFYGRSTEAMAAPASRSCLPTRKLRKAPLRALATPSVSRPLRGTPLPLQQPHVRDERRVEQTRAHARQVDVTHQSEIDEDRHEATAGLRGERGRPLQPGARDQAIRVPL